jgi:4-alpha-glucanotransferase
MNLPNSTEGNWNWRFKTDALTEGIGERLRGLTELYGRAQQKAVREADG